MDYHEIIESIIKLSHSPLGGAIITGLLIPLFQFIKNKYLQGKNTLIANASGIVQVDHYLNDAIKELPINRAMVLQGHNSGGRPRLLNPMFITCLNESSSRDVRNLLRDIQKLPTDAEHMKIIRDLLVNETVTIERVKLLKDGYIRPLYEELNVVYSKLFLLEADDKTLTYLALFFDDKAPEPDQLTYQQRNTINLLKQNIKKEIAKQVR